MEIDTYYLMKETSNSGVILKWTKEDQKKANDFPKEFFDVSRFILRMATEHEKVLCQQNPDNIVALDFNTGDYIIRNKQQKKSDIDFQTVFDVDKVAIKAMQGILSNRDCNYSDIINISKASYALAEQMLKERNSRLFLIAQRFQH